MKTFKDIVETCIAFQPGFDKQKYPIFTARTRQIHVNSLGIPAVLNDLIVSLYYDVFMRLISLRLEDGQVIRVRVPLKARNGLFIKRLNTVRKLYEKCMYY
jgi:hypothetical protein